VTNTGNAEQNGNAAAEQAAGIPPQNQSAPTPSDRQIAEYQNERASKNRDYFIITPWKRFVCRPITALIAWLDQHSSTVTAAATAAIAILTYFLASYAYDQGISADKQWRIMQSQVDDTRAQISAFLTIPESPETTIKLGDDWHMILDFYLANVGQSAARDVYLDTAFILTSGANDSFPVTFKIGGGPILIPTTAPWHHIFDLGLPTNVTMYNGLPKPGQPPNTSQLIMMPVRFTADLKGDATFTTVFGKTLKQPISLAAGFTDSRILCCDLLQLQKGIPMIYPADVNRLPPDVTRQKPHK